MSQEIKQFWDLSEEQFNLRIDSREDFYKHLLVSDNLKNFVYWPNELIPIKKAEFKIENKTFTNCSFAFTQIKNITFQNCIFTNCKFNHAEIIECSFHDCSFKYVNMFRVKVYKTYIEPNSFRNIIPNIIDFRGSVKNSNMCVSLFQEILDNSKNEGQPDHTKNADYHFKKWKGLNYIQKRFFPSPGSKKISNWFFVKKFGPNLFSYLFTGYGYRISNFLITFVIGFAFFFFVNYWNWSKYGLEQKDLCIDSFCSKTPNVLSDLYYTLDCTTKLVDSQFQATTDFGMFCLAAQSIFGFFLLGSLLTIISNKFVR
jgi:uncharacterized protein YjbI with pentapeptide repeats